MGRGDWGTGGGGTCGANRQKERMGEVEAGREGGREAIDSVIQNSEQTAKQGVTARSRNLDSTAASVTSPTTTTNTHTTPP